MGEAKRRMSPLHHQPARRSWATGRISVTVNDVARFTWEGTRADADTIARSVAALGAVFGAVAESYAMRAVGYLLCYGMPKVGEPDLRPSQHGERWHANDVEMYRRAVLWRVLRETVPNAGQTVSEIFVGKELQAIFSGDKAAILDYTARELTGADLNHSNLEMMVGVAATQCLLDPAAATAMRTADLYALADLPPPPPELAEKPIYVPRVPLDETEARAMLNMMVITTDVTVAAPEIRTYAGYTDAELSGGRPALRIR